MRASIQLLRGLFLQPWYRALWTLLLGVVNFVVPWFFIDQLEAQVVLGVFIVNSITMIALSDISSSTHYGLWIRALIALNSLALLFNLIDVGLFIWGDRKSLL